MTIAELEKLFRECDENRDRIDDFNALAFKLFPTLLAQFREMEAALEFYADESRYDHIHTARIGVNARDECGRVARECLNKVRGE